MPWDIISNLQNFYATVNLLILFYIAVTSYLHWKFCDNLLKESRMKSSQVPRVPLQSPIVKFVALFNLIQEGSEHSQCALCGFIWNYNFIIQLSSPALSTLSHPSLPSFSGYQLNY